MDRELFAGVQKHHGLSNALELANRCPPEFRSDDNPWSQYAAEHVEHLPNPVNWEWQAGVSEDELADFIRRVNQRHCFDGILRDTVLPLQEKRAVAGWMLSQMLKCVPEVLALA